MLEERPGALSYIFSGVNLAGVSVATGALLANQTEATGIVIIARWLLENNLNV